MNKFTVALLQLVGRDDDPEANLATGLEACRRAAAVGADLALFPEMWNVGYPTYAIPDSEQRERFLAQAIPPDHEFVTRHRALARELEMAIAVTFLEATDRGPRNTVIVFDRRGEQVLSYSKVHTCDFAVREALCAPGDSFGVGTLALDEHRCLTLGAMICYDREFPESARLLMLKGTEVVLTPNACFLDELRVDQFKARAYENAMGVAMTNYAAPKENGHSVAFDADGQLLVHAGERKGLFFAHFDLDALREYRSKTIWGNAFRRPHRYAELSSMEIAPPFVRDTALGNRFERSER